LIILRTIGEGVELRTCSATGPDYLVREARKGLRRRTVRGLRRGVRERRYSATVMPAGMVGGSMYAIGVFMP
jgi:hypothetical protein